MFAKSTKGVNRIPLWEFHVRELGADMGEFAGWEVPMMYTGALQEHMIVRTDAGVFDVSHMGRIRVSGPDAEPFLQRIFTKNIAKTKEYHLSGPTLVLNAYARVKDDEMPYKVSDEEWLVVVNALYRDKMLKYYENVIKTHNFDVRVEDLTSKYAMIAIQGPRSAEILEKICGDWIHDLRALQFRIGESVGEHDAFLISRSGWTGEDGFEIWAEPKNMVDIYRALLKAGVKPVGIICRDMLRIEMGYVLGEHEYGEDPLRFPPANSLRYGLGAIDWNKRGFVGEEALRAYRREGVRWVRVGIKMRRKHARAVIRQGYKLYVEDQVIGWVTSGTYSPYLKTAIGQAYVDVRYAIFGDIVEVEIRGKRYEGKIVEFPLVRGRPVVR